MHIGEGISVEKFFHRWHKLLHFDKKNLFFPLGKSAQMNQTRSDKIQVDVMLLVNTAFPWPHNIGYVSGQKVISGIKT